MIITFTATPGGAHLRYGALRNYLQKLPYTSYPEMLGEEYRVITSEQEAPLVMESITFFGGTVIVPAEEK